MPISKIRAYLSDNRPGHLEQLKELLRFPSISAQPQHHDDCVACAEWLARQFDRLGMDTQVDTSTAKPLVWAQGPQRPDRPTLLVYGHYDVQPPEPLELWPSPPFEPTEMNGDLVARGASDDKGQLFTWLKAVEAWRETAGEPPVNLKFLIEGEEEIGSPTLEKVIAENRTRLAADAVAISDSSFFADGVPSLTYGLRGLVYVEVTLTGPNRDLHSGLYGGVVTNPLNALAKLVADLHDTSGRVTLDGFYDNVVPLADSERNAWKELQFDPQAEAADLGVDALAGEANFTPLQRCWARPALDCNGMWGGYTGQGAKTVIPSWAKAKLSARLVANQKPQAVLHSIDQYFQNNRPAGTSVQIQRFSSADPWLVDADWPGLRFAREAIAEAFERPCTLVRNGASIPVTVWFHKHLHRHPLLMGYGLPDDRLHSPGEKFRIDHYYKGILAGTLLMGKLAENFTPTS